MTTADFATADRPAPSPFARTLRAVVGWVASRREARAKKAALQSLLFAPEHRLRDLWITREELLAAFKTGRK